MKTSALFTMMFAVTLELIGTTSLKLADGSSRPVWYLLVVAGYGGAFYFFSWAIRTIPIGIAYAVWAGLGIVGTALIGSLFFRQHLSAVMIAGIIVILLGIAMVNLGSSPMEGIT